MASEKQIKANRENSKAAGVKSVEGKRKIRFNALKHGLTSKHMLDLEDCFQEEKESYLEILEGLVESIGPKNFLEEMLVDQMARALFKLHRCEALETASFKAEHEVFGSGKVFDLDEDRSRRAGGYRNKIESQFYRAKGELMRARGVQQLDLFSLSEVSDD